MTTSALLIVLGAYLIGSIPFGYLLGRLKGVDLFKIGSGNIGATNVGRVLGRECGILIFLIDFAKGALPVAFSIPVANRIGPEVATAFGQQDALRVAVALAAFLGHLFPIYLGFRGGKGVATGAGAMLVLLPGPTAIAAVIWLAVAGSTLYVSLASLMAAAAVCFAHFLATAHPFGEESVILTVFCLGAVSMVCIKHRGNIARLANGSESQLNNTGAMQLMRNSLHVIALGLWFGSGAFFIGFAAMLFPTFKDVVRTAPSDRTADLPLAAGASDQQKDQLASALAGAAVGPMFPPFFALQAACGAIALVTALGWRKAAESIHGKRTLIISLALLGVIAGWPISMKVSELRVLRFSSDSSIAESARSAFGTWHEISLLLTFFTTICTFIALAMAGRLPGNSDKMTG
jgi:acyl-phosphate glycerol 3-phosphate acyltransferase